VGGVLKGERGVACLEMGVALFLVLDVAKDEEGVEFCDLCVVIGDGVNE
jgi:hypothetical protein